VKTPRFDKTYLDEKRRQLRTLRENLSGVRNAQAAEEGTINEQVRNEAHEFEEDAQKLATLEIEGTLVARSDARLADVERALQKIDEGTYGLSEASGEAIPAERLDAKPEALYTIKEQEARDAKA